MVAGIQENSFKEKKNDCGVSDVVVAGIHEHSGKEKKSGGSQMEPREARLLTTIQIEESLSKREQEQLQNLVLEFADIFALDESELSSTDLVTHVIDTGDTVPVKQHPRRIPFALRDRVDQLVKEMLDQGVVTPSKSPWASPVVLVAKKDGSTRFCVDYRRINSVTKTDVFPLPPVDDSLDQLSNSQYFTTLDLAAG